MSMEELDALDTRQRDLIKKIMLTVIDKHRVEHIDEMSYLREKVSLRSYAQQDPLVIYKKEAYEKFQSFLKTIKKETLSTVMRAQFVAPVAGVASVPLPTSPERRGVGQDATPAGSAALDDIVNQLM